VAPFVAGGAHADAVMGARVQQAAASLAVIVYTTLGKSSLAVITADLPESAKDMIWQKVEEETGECAEDGDLEDPDDEAGGGEELPGEGLDLCVTGVAIHVPKELKKVELTATDGVEETFMDEILEETGLVFQGKGLNVAHQPKDAFAASPLDEELRGLGLLEGAGAL